MKNALEELNMVVHAYKPSTGEAGAERLQVQGQPELHDKTMFQKKKRKIEKRNKNSLLIYIFQNF
jgi:hypothetical protein